MNLERMVGSWKTRYGYGNEAELVELRERMYKCPKWTGYGCGGYEVDESKMKVRRRDG